MCDTTGGNDCGVGVESPVSPPSAPDDEVQDEQDEAQEDIENGTDPHVEPPDPAAESPELSEDDLRNKTPEELEQLAEDLGLEPHPTEPGIFLDPKTGKARIIIHPEGHPHHRPGRSRDPHVHGFRPLGPPLKINKIGDSEAGGDAHFPLR